MIFKNIFPNCRIKPHFNIGLINLRRYSLCFSIEVRIFKFGFLLAKDFYIDLPDNGVYDDNLYYRLV